MKTTWRIYNNRATSNPASRNTYYVCMRDKEYIGQYTVFADGRITAHSKTHNTSITDIINEFEARKFITTGVKPICKPPEVTTAIVVAAESKQQTLLPPTQEQEIMRQQRIAGGDNDGDDELDDQFYKLMRGY